MRKIFAYACGPEEMEFFPRYAARFGFEVTCVPDRPWPENAHWAKGYDCVSIVSAKYISREMIDTYLSGGTTLLASRAIGVDNIELGYAKQRGLAVVRNTYSAASVADYAVMLALMITRCTKAALLRNQGQDYTYQGFRGKQLDAMTVGIIGTGNIGAVAARRFAAFDGRVLCWSRHKKPELEGIAEYVPLDVLLAESDLISLHLATNKETTHFLNRETIAKMKDGAFVVNTARGDLVDNLSLIEALESGKLAGAALDVVDGDRMVYYADRKNEIIPHRELAILRSMPNVILTPHLAFYTDTVMEDMVVNSLEACRRFYAGEETPLRVV